MRTLIAAAFFALAIAIQAADQPASDYTGHYELVKTTKSAFSFDVLQKGKSATTSFSAGRVDGGGAAPDGDGQGQLNDKGELKFTWTDTFDNAGTAIFRQEGKVYHLTLKPTKVADPRAVALYGDIVLKRTSTKPQMSTR